MRRALAAVVITTLVAAAALAVESGRYRLLSVSQTTKIILVSKIPDKTKYVLDASTAKITLNDKPAELADLQSFTVAIVKFELKKGVKSGIDIDGVATEIKITNPDKEPSKPPSKAQVSS